MMNAFSVLLEAREPSLFPLSVVPLSLDAARKSVPSHRLPCCLPEFPRLQQNPGDLSRPPDLLSKRTVL